MGSRFLLKGSRVVFQPSFFHWRTNSFRGKSIVKIVTPVDMRLIQMSLALQPNKKNTCHSSGYIGAMGPFATGSV